jgi:hypothetical protein
MLGSSDLLPKILLHTAFNTGHNQGCWPVCLATVAIGSHCDNQTAAVDSDHRRPERCLSEVKPVKLASGK